MSSDNNLEEFAKEVWNLSVILVEMKFSKLNNLLYVNKEYISEKISSETRKFILLLCW